MQAMKGSVHDLVREGALMRLTSQEATQEVIDTYTAQMYAPFALQLNKAIADRAEVIRKRRESKRP